VILVELFVENVAMTINLFAGNKTFSSPLLFSYNRLLVMFTQSERQQQTKIRWRGILIPRYYLLYLLCLLFTVEC